MNVDSRSINSNRKRNTKNRQLLTREAYTSQLWFEREQRELFAKSWSFVGMTDDLKLPGDYKCLEVGGAPYFLVRDEEGCIRAFHNICRHRGSLLLEGSGNIGKTVTCFYHHWSYGLDGALRGVPQQRAEFPSLDKSCLGLLNVQVETWRNLIFINPDMKAGQLASWLAGAPDEMESPDPRNLVEVADLLYLVKANWKVVIENSIDAYHLFYLHDVSLSDGDFFGLQQWASGLHWHERRGLKQGYSHDKLELPVIGGMSPNFGFAGCWLFPNVVLVAQATMWLTFHVIPVSADQSMVNIRIRAAPEALAQNSLLAETAQQSLPAYMLHARGPFASLALDDSKSHPLQSYNIISEDIYACEAMQRGMSSPSWAVGPLSSWEESISFFQQNILNFVSR